MSLRTAAALTVASVLSLTACSGGPTTTDKLSYQMDQSLTALVIGARAASVDIVVGDGPVTVTEEYRYSRGKPRTAHQVEGQRLRLTESGCGDDDARCDVTYTIRMPEAMSVDIAAEAGAVKLDGLAGNLRVTTEAAAVEGRGLTSDQVIIQTEAGAATLEFVEAPTLVRTTTALGGINLRLPGSTAYAVDVRSQVGASAVDVDRDPTSAHQIEVHTEVGGVKIERLA
ncbi:MAG TPA: hypothetical protein VEQ66_00070 [Propionibacteriaceae bacterium]|nr:hypothetical protein [Propionibacteriaceae bacterium]